MSQEAYEAADALGAAIGARDVEAIRALYADDVEVWHASTNAKQGKEENSGLLAAVFAVTSQLAYEQIRRHPVEGGVVQQHVLTGTFADGTAIPDLNVSIYIYAREGKIVRIEEYFDSATFAPVWEKLAAAPSL